MGVVGPSNKGPRSISFREIANMSYEEYGSVRPKLLAALRSEGMTFAEALSDIRTEIWIDVDEQGNATFRFEKF